MHGSVKTLLPNWSLPLTMAALALVLAIMGDRAWLPLRYSREALASGELWRLFSGHWVHLGWSHLILNLAGLLVVWALVGDVLSRLGWFVLVSAGSLFISLALWFFYPQLQWYVGLSGLLHSMLLAGALLQFVGGDRGAAVLALLVIGKVGWETLWGPLPGSESAAGGAVVTEAHLYGAVAGGMFATLVLRCQVCGRLFLAELRESEESR